MSKRRRSPTRGADPRHPVGNHGFNDSPVRSTQEAWTASYRDLLTNLAINRYVWDGLPENEIDTRFLEWALTFYGMVVFFQDTADLRIDRQVIGGKAHTDRFFAMAGSPGGVVNMYQNPTTFYVVGNAMMSGILNARQGVPIWNNFTRTPTSPTIGLFADSLATNRQTETINLRAMRHTQIVSMTEAERLTYMNFERMIDEGNPVIYTRDGLDPTDTARLTKVDLGVDKDQVLTVGIARSRTWGEAMTFLGIDNAFLEKKERMVTDEVKGNDSATAAIRGIGLAVRQSAARQINDMFGLNVSVEWNENVGLMSELMASADSGGE